MHAVGKKTGRPYGETSKSSRSSMEHPITYPPYFEAECPSASMRAGSYALSTDLS
jgi:hypothetical protein